PWPHHSGKQAGHRLHLHARAPLRGPSADAMTRAAATEEGKAMILVVDDFEDNRDMYAEYLTYSGYRVMVATNGQEALDRAFENAPDLGVMDLSLPLR